MDLDAPPMAEERPRCVRHRIVAVPQARWKTTRCPLHLTKVEEDGKTRDGPQQAQQAQERWETAKTAELAACDGDNGQACGSRGSSPRIFCSMPAPILGHRSRAFIVPSRGCVNTGSTIQLTRPHQEYFVKGITRVFFSGIYSYP